MGDKISIAHYPIAYCLLPDIRPLLLNPRQIHIAKIDKKGNIKIF